MIAKAYQSAKGYAVYSKRILCCNCCEQANISEPREGGFAVVVLAAGMSPGRGRPKQLLPYLGRTLVEHAARTALASGASEVVVVVGPHAEEVRHQLRTLPVRVVQNRDCSEGMASSIRAGLSRLSGRPQAAIIALCDQPNITPAHLRSLGEKVLADYAPPIAASSYDGVLGAPCAFHRSMFPRLLELRGQAGARNLIREASAQVEAISFPNANDEVEVPNCFRPLLPVQPGPPLAEFRRDSSEPRAPPSDSRTLAALWRS